MDNELLNELISQLDEVSEMLYQEKLKPAYEKLVVIIPGIENIINGLEAEKQEVIKDRLLAVLGAFEDNDPTLLADTIKYELIEGLQEL